MSETTRHLTRAYKMLLALYPASFRAEFGEEMGQTFAQSVSDSRALGSRALVLACLREVSDAPGAAARQWTNSLRIVIWRLKGETMNTHADQPVSVPSRPGSVSPAPWGQALLAAAALLIPGLSWSLSKIPLGDIHSSILGLSAFGFVLACILVAWLKGFPRWSFPYLGYGLLFTLILRVDSTPGLRLLGHTFVRHEVWGWRAWLGPAAVVVLALLITRSLRPLARLFTGAWKDWTRLSFALYACLPFYFWAIFDEVHRPYPEIFLTLTVLCLTAAALAAMRSRSDRGFMAWLLAGLCVSWLLGSAVLSVYWDGFQRPGWPEPIHWSDHVLPMTLGLVGMSVVMLAPGLVGLVRRAVRSRG